MPRPRVAERAPPRIRRPVAGALRLLAPALVAVLVAGPAAAHKLRVFAFADGARIQGSAYFAGGGKAQGARIRVQDGRGRVLAELTPGADGSFAYLAQAPEDHIVIADSGDGHRAEWRVSAAELAGGFPRGASDAAPPAASASASASSSAADVGADAGIPRPMAPGSRPADAPGARTGLDPDLELAIERAVARQVRPLREALLADRDRARLHDVMGGIGYILGLLGIALWWRARRTAPAGSGAPSAPRPDAAADAPARPGSGPG